MNNEGELKLEFENFIEDLVRDVVKDTMKSLVYEDLKKLYDEYYKNASNLKNTIEKGKNYNKEIDNIISKLNISHSCRIHRCLHLCISPTYRSM